MFAAADFAHLRFLEGRWVGRGPDGADFYERYSSPGDGELRSERFPDAAFAAPTDGSVVALRDGRIVSAWREFTWEASDPSPGRACFAPVSAPSAFCREQASADEVRVTQRWADEHGAPQQYAVTLRRL